MSAVVGRTPAGARADRALTIDNPYWARVAPYAKQSKYDWEPGLQVGAPDRGGFADGYMVGYELRRECVDRYAWTITDPATVRFVARYCGPQVIDPMAGSGYWAYLLGQCGVDVVAYDSTPPGAGGNPWHKAGVVHGRVDRTDAVEAIDRFSPGRTLLLSWPPYDDPIGARTLTAYLGDRVIYIGEGPSGCCGDDGMFAAFDAGWTEHRVHQPVQFYGLHDFVTVFDRK